MPSTHPIIGLTLIPLVMKWPLIFSPVHVVFLELIIDPACSVVFEAEPEEKGIMNRRPRSTKEPLFGRKVLGISVLQGLVVLAILVALYAVSLARGQTADQARALTFTALIVANLALILTNRSWSRGIVATLRTRNTALWWVLGGAVAFLGLVLYVPALERVVPLRRASPAGSGPVPWRRAVQRRLVRRAEGGPKPARASGPGHCDLRCLRRQESRRNVT